MKILIVFLSGLGNMVLFTPTLRSIRGKYANAEINMWLKEKTGYELIENANLVDEILPYYHGKVKNLLKQMLLLLKLRKRKYDLIITTFDAQGWKLAFFVKAIGARVSIGYKTGSWYDRLYSDLLPFSSDIHEIDRHLKIVDFLGASVKEKKVELVINQEDEQFARTIMQANELSAKDLLIGIHPGSSENLVRKRWMPDRFAKVADYLAKEYGARIVIFGGPQEVLLSEELVGFMKVSKPIVLAGKTTVSQTAAMIAKCKIFICNDSGLMHVAAAVNTPTIAIFGPTNPIKNAPFGEGHIIVRKNIPCSPCLTYLENGCDSIECLETLTVGDVLVAVKDKLISAGIVNQ